MFYPIKLVPLYRLISMIMAGAQWLIAHCGGVGDNEHYPVEQIADSTFV